LAVAKKKATRPVEKEMSVLDIVYVLAAIAVFAVIGLVARGVEKL